MEFIPLIVQTVTEILIAVLAIWGLGSATKQIIRFQQKSVLLYPAIGVYALGCLIMVSLGISSVAL